MKIIDLHCDTIARLTETGESLYQNQGHFDLARAQEAGLALQVFSLFVYPAEQSAALKGVFQQIDKFYQEIEQYSQLVYPLLYMEDYKPDNNRLAALLHLEGGECLGTDLEFLRILYRLGLRSVGLTWNDRNLLADGVKEGENAGGLSRAGRKMVREMRRLGMLLDLSHIAPMGFYQAIDEYQGPVLVTHANVRNLCDHPRNLDDNQLKTLAKNGGVIGLNQVSDFVKASPKPNLDDFIDHIVYISELIGVKNVALGSDFDGADQVILPGVDGYIQLELFLEQRGFTRQEIEMIFSKNVERVIKQILK
ncbi:MAG TPA: dipeptidase [Syntrophomonadaceae bacterium]|nr:dipeptidase [Syntrophomonadaceae bacterium]HQE22519.1 dipeptidase [Syntrophomonadaceae bacterium]